MVRKLIVTASLLLCVVNLEAMDCPTSRINGGDLTVDSLSDGPPPAHLMQLNGEHVVVPLAEYNRLVSRQSAHSSSQSAAAAAAITTPEDTRSASSKEIFTKPSSKFTPEHVDDLINACSQDLRDYADDIKHIGQYDERVPRFGLLTGPPGVGKTETAKAIALYAKLPFKFQAASEIPNAFKNSGPANLRALFSPLLERKCIVILDELTGLTDRHNSDQNPDPGMMEFFF